MDAAAAWRPPVSCPDRSVSSWACSRTRPNSASCSHAFSTRMLSVKLEGASRQPDWLFSKRGCLGTGFTAMAREHLDRAKLVPYPRRPWCHVQPSRVGSWLQDRPLRIRRALSAPRFRFARVLFETLWLGTPGRARRRRPSARMLVILKYHAVHCGPARMHEACLGASHPPRRATMANF